MSVFKRLGNVARGKVKEFGRSLEEGLDGLDGVFETSPAHTSEPSESDEPSARRAGPTDDQKRQMLDRLLEEGLLTEEEHQEKRLALDEPTPMRPKKRHL